MTVRPSFSYGSPYTRLTVRPSRAALKNSSTLIGASSLAPASVSAPTESSLAAPNRGQTEQKVPPSSRYSNGLLARARQAQAGGRRDPQRRTRHWECLTG